MPLDLPRSIRRQRQMFIIDMLLVDPNDVGYIGGMVLVSGRARLVTVPEDEAVLELRELKSSM